MRDIWKIISDLEQGQRDHERRKEQFAKDSKDPNLLADCDVSKLGTDRLEFLPIWNLVCLSQGINPSHYMIRTVDTARLWVNYFDGEQRVKLDKLLKLLVTAEGFAKANELKSVDSKSTVKWFFEWAAASGVPTVLSFTALVGGRANVVKATVEVDADSESKPWLQHDARDPTPKHLWYTPARYFARQLALEKSTLLTNRGLLAEKVSTALFNVGIKKRGGIKKFDSATVLKAFVNVHFN